MSQIAGRIVLLLACALVWSAPAKMWAQIAQGSISGEVTDSSGALVVNALVLLTNTNTQITDKTHTNAQGIYVFPKEEAGNYVVKVLKKGFRAEKVSVTLEVAEQRRVDVQLRVGAESATVTVNSDTVAIDRSTSSLGLVITQSEVQDLPLNGDNVFALAALAPGVIGAPSFGENLTQNDDAVLTVGAANFRVNGGITASNEILLDGIPVIVCCQGQPALIPNSDIISQFKAQTNTPPANFGDSGGGALNFITRSGGAQLHGDLYEFMRNSIFDAAPWFVKAAGTPPIPGRDDYRLPLVFDHFGGTLTGPLVVPHLLNNHRTFFALSFGGTTDSQKNYKITTVPTPQERTGDFTQSPGIIYDPLTVSYVNGIAMRSPLPSNSSGVCCVIPQNRQNAVAMAMLSLFPEANLPTPQSPSTINNYGYVYGVSNTDRQYNLRIDEKVSDRYRFFVRGIVEQNMHYQAGLFDSFTDANSEWQRIRAIVGEWDNTFILSPRTVLNAHYGYVKEDNVSRGGAQYFPAGNFGLPANFIAEQQIPGVPPVSISGGYPTTSNNTNGNSEHYTNIYGASIISQFGRHTLQYGWDGRLYFNAGISPSDGTGDFSVTDGFTSGPAATSTIPAAQVQFDALASFELGYPSSGGITVYAKTDQTQPYNAFYVQDDWRVTPNFTLNMGLRYNLDAGAEDKKNAWSELDPTGINPLSAELNLPFTGTIVFPGTTMSRRFWRMPKDEFAPRLGFAYAMNPTVVFSGAYGLMYLPTTTRLYNSGNPSFAVTTQFLGTANGINVSGTLSDPFPNGILPIVGAAGGPTSNTGASISSLIYDTVPGYVQQWNFSTASQLNRNTTLRISYAGGMGVHLPIYLEPNQLNPKYFSTPGDVAAALRIGGTAYPNPFAPYVSSGILSSSTVVAEQLLAAFPQYSGVTEQYLSRGQQSYNALQANLRHQSRLITTTVSYTWSKSLGNVNNNTTGFLDTGTPGYQNSYVLNIERAPNPLERTQSFNAAVIGSLPFGRGQRFFANMPRWLNTVVGGWQLTTISTVQNGLPLAISNTGQPLLAGSRPMYVPGVSPTTQGPVRSRLGGNYSTTSYLNPSAFAYPLAFQFGDVPRLAANLRAPKVMDFDVSGVKTVHLFEKWSLQLRGEAFNLVNYTQFSEPGVTYGAGSFGTITAQSNEPREIQLAMKLLW